MSVCKTSADVGVAYLSEPEHLLHESPRLNGIVHVHLLQGREVTRCEIPALKPVITRNLDERVLIVVVIGLELQLTCRTEEYDGKQYVEYFSWQLTVTGFLSIIYYIMYPVAKVLKNIVNSKL